MSTGWKVFLALVAVWFVWSYYERKRITAKLSNDLSNSGYVGPSKGSALVTPVATDALGFNAQFVGNNPRIATA